MNALLYRHSSAFDTNLHMLIANTIPSITRLCIQWTLVISQTQVINGIIVHLYAMILTSCQNEVPFPSIKSTGVF